VPHPSAAMYRDRDTSCVHVFFGRFEESQHHRVQLGDYGGFRGSHRPDGLTPVEQPSAVPGRGERDDKSEEAVGQRQSHQVGEGEV